MYMHFGIYGKTSEALCVLNVCVHALEKGRGAADVFVFSKITD